MVKRTKQKKQDLLSVALWVFLALSMDIVVHMIVSNLMQDGTLLRDIVGKSITTIIWLITIIIVCRYNKKNNIFSIKSSKKNIVNMLLYVGVAITIIIVNILLKGLGTIQLFHEFTLYTGKYSTPGIIVFIIQILYYFCEAALAIFIVIFGQAWGEKKYGKPVIPFGGIVMAITWGAIHFLSKDVIVGFYGMGISLLIGTGYIAIKKNPVWGYILALILFII